MHCNNLRLVLGLGLVRVSSRVRVKVRVSVLVRVSIRTNWVVYFALFRCYRPVIYTCPHTSISGSVTQSYESVDMQKRFAITSELQTFYTQEQKVPIFRDTTYKFIVYRIA